MHIQSRCCRDILTLSLGFLFAWHPTPACCEQTIESRIREAKMGLRDVNPEALALAIRDLQDTFGDRYPLGPEALDRAQKIERRIPKLLMGLDAGDEQALLEARQVIEFQREALLSNPLLDFDKIILIKRAESQLGLPQNWQGNCSLPQKECDNQIVMAAWRDPSREMKTLFCPDSGQLVADMDLRFDGKALLFSMPGINRRWRIWEIQPDGSGLRSVTPEELAAVDNYDACYLPDGRIVFASTLCYQGIPCVGGGDSVANLCSMGPQGENVRQLCFDQDHNWCPAVLNDGRVLYSRWEYSDTPHYFSRLLFTMNPDGTNQAALYGSNSYWPNSIFYARAIPEHPTQVVGIVSGHHGVPRMGELVILDVSRGRYEGSGVVQRIPGRGKPVPPVIEDQLVDASWPRFLHPYPLSDKYFLVSCQTSEDPGWGIRLVDVFDNSLLLLKTPKYNLFEPIPLRPSPCPPILHDKVRLDQQDATVFLSNVYAGGGLRGIPKGSVKKLRLYEFHYAYPKMGGHRHIGMEGPWDVHRILGTVPVCEDGSAVFKVPANIPLAVQPLDEDGQALQVMRSWFTAMPGEKLSCVGCHESQSSVTSLALSTAGRQPVSEIDPWRGPARGFSFPREVQPVLDRFCVGCHTAEKSDKIPDFSRRNQKGTGGFSMSYLALHPFVRRPGPESDYHLQTPMEFHASTSELIQRLRKGHHGVKLDEEAWDRLITWIDLNVPDHGTWGEHAPGPRDMFRDKRLQMRTRYANRPEDPEAIPETATGTPEFVAPETIADPGEEISNLKFEMPPEWPLSLEEAIQKQQTLGEPLRRTVDLGSGVSLDLVKIPAGEFVMGSSEGDLDEKPVSRQSVESPFWMGVVEVTNKQYGAFDPSHDSGVFDQHNKDHTLPGYPANGPEQPVVRVTWQDAMSFCDWLSGHTGLHFALPTELQWEWACRAGSQEAFSFGNLNTDFSTFANLADQSMQLFAVAGINPQPIQDPDPFEDFLPKDARFNDGAMVTKPVGQYEPNAWGLQDMHGNVAEWTLSSDEPYPYNSLDGRDDPASTRDKVARGGSWRDRPSRSTSSFRLPYKSFQPVYNVGFRVVAIEG